MAGNVVGDGGALDDAVAALLHDVLEDQDSGRTRVADVEQFFGVGG